MFLETAKEVVMILLVFACANLLSSLTYLLLILIMFSINSSDKSKCYEVIRKLSDIYQSDKEYLKVCNLKTHAFNRQNTLFCVLFTHSNAIVCLHIVGRGLAAAHSAEGGRGAGQERGTEAMASNDQTPLRLL